ncbi:MAG: UDP-2,3-diacylglucosamine diphosphatase [Methylotenera sp.]|nr:UDP-2,3-diacylglucosamine diphosphatase [Methylotenera sp.]
MTNSLKAGSYLPDTYLFISDLHLCASRPHITQAFLDFLANKATKAHSVYILGDLFEYWAGDDAIEDSFIQEVINGFRDLAQRGVNLNLMHGNRDFLIADAFSNAANIRLIQDPTLLNTHGLRILLSHGDALCTDDHAYQEFRQLVRSDEWQSQFLAQPLDTRKKQIEEIRTRSEQEKSIKSMQIMDVNSDAVDALIRAYQYPDFFIHGHTHRPSQHSLIVDNHKMTRWVLGDWYEQGSYLALDASGFRNVTLNT